MILVSLPVSDFRAGDPDGIGAGWKRHRAGEQENPRGESEADPLRLLACCSPAVSCSPVLLFRSARNSLTGNGTRGLRAILRSRPAPQRDQRKWGIADSAQPIPHHHLKKGAMIRIILSIWDVCQVQFGTFGELSMQPNVFRPINLTRHAESKRRNLKCSRQPSRPSSLCVVRPG